MKARLLMALVVVLSLCGCGAEDLYTSDYACRFVFNTKYHAGTSIETALNGPGMYTMISASKIGGVWHIYSTLNDGQDKTEDIRLNTAEENYADYSDLGAANGIIIGLSNFNGLVAWDRQCANCLREPVRQLLAGSWRIALSSAVDGQRAVCGMRQLRKDIRVGDGCCHGRRPRHFPLSLQDKLCGHRLRGECRKLGRSLKICEILGVLDY